MARGEPAYRQGRQLSAPNVVLYATSCGPDCDRARKLLAKKGVTFTEIDIEAAPEKRAEMQTRSGRRTVPQIFIGDHHVGGSGDLHALEAAGGLDSLLGR